MVRYKNIPHMFMERVRETPDRTAFRFKESGVWKSMTWKEVYDRVISLASELLDWISRGDRVAIYSYTRPEWVICDLAIQCAGGISVPIYQTLPADQAQYILNDSHSVLVFAETYEHVERIKGVRDSLPHVKKVVSFSDVKEDGWVESLRTFEERGIAKRNEKRIMEIVDNIKPDDLATLVYTSGTTGFPKGVMQTHLNHLSMCEMLSDIGDIVEDEEVLLFLPLAHSFARAIEFFQIRKGFTISFAESIDKVVSNLQEVSPTVFPSVPRVFEKVYATIKSETQKSSVKKKIFDWAINVGREFQEKKKRKEEIPLSLKMKHMIAHKLVFSKIHKKVGGRIRFFVSGGAPLSKEIAEFMWAMGLLILEGYGLTETCPALTINRIDDFKFGTVGKPLKGVEIKIAEDGEIIARGPNIAKGYWNKPEETAEVFKEGGWFHTGDIGEFDEDGFLKITDRKKDLIKTAGGKYVAPQPIENKIKAQSPVISQVVVIGDTFPYCTALITINKEEVEKLKLSEDEVRKEVERAVQEVNKTLASFETIKKWRIVPDFSIDSGDLTPTLKVKRKVVMQKYWDVIKSMYEEEGGGKE